MLNNLQKIIKMLFLRNLKVLKVFLGLVLLFAANPLFSGELYNPIAVYLTWTKSPETTMSIQWISMPSDVRSLTYSS